MNDISVKIVETPKDPVESPGEGGENEVDPLAIDEDQEKVKLDKPEEKAGNGDENAKEETTENQVDRLIALQSEKIKGKYNISSASFESVCLRR